VTGKVKYYWKNGKTVRKNSSGQLIEHGQFELVLKGEDNAGNRAEPVIIKVIVSDQVVTLENRAQLNLYSATAANLTTNTDYWTDICEDGDGLKNSNGSSVGITRSILKDTTGAPVPWKVLIHDYPNSTAYSQFYDVTKNTSPYAIGGFPAQVNKEGLRLREGLENECHIIFHGLDPNKFYDFKFTGLKQATTGEVNMSVADSATGQQVIFNVINNTKEYELTNLQPGSDGKISIINSFYSAIGHVGRAETSLSGFIITEKNGLGAIGTGGSDPDPDPDPTAALTWKSWEITTQSTALQQGKVISDIEDITADIEFYQSTNIGGVEKGNLFSQWNGNVHPNTNAKVQNYWANATGDVYPYAGKSTMGRGTETGENNAPDPQNVMDLQLHPPQDATLTVAAFTVPVDGTYTVQDLGVRRLSTNGAVVRFRVFDNNKNQITSLVTVDNSQNWVLSSTVFDLGELTAGDQIYFATDREGDWAFDMAEVMWTVTGTPTNAGQTWHSYEIVTQSDPSKQGKVNSDAGTEAELEFYVSTTNNSVAQGGLFPMWNGITHPDGNAFAQNYWANTSGQTYPYAGKSTVGRGSETGEGTAPFDASGVFDLHLHPPIDDKLTVAAFIAPVAGDYTVSALGVRRLSTNGLTVRFRVFDKNQAEVANLITVDNSRAWVTSASPVSVGTLAAGDKIYFATDRHGDWAFDLTEITFSVHVNGGGSSMMMMSEPAARTASIEQPEDYKIVVYDRFGHRLKEFNHSALPSEIENVNFRPQVTQRGLYTFHIIDKKNNIEIQRIMFTE
jgi:hypothetical protein